MVATARADATTNTHSSESGRFYTTPNNRIHFDSTNTNTSAKYVRANIHTNINATSPQYDDHTYRSNVYDQNIGDEDDDDDDGSYSIAFRSTAYSNLNYYYKFKCMQKWYQSYLNYTTLIVFTIIIKV